jgi:nucleoside-diphosphate-sugar epimerase
MEASGNGTTVLVTGGSGFLGGWCIAELLNRGHRVRTTLRSPAREGEVRENVARAGADAGDRLEFAVADLTADAGWVEAVAGAGHVLHVASPFPPKQPKDPDELIVPARDGALRVLRAALAEGVERIVLTSSVAAVRNNPGAPAPPVLTEEHWSDPDHPSLTPYTRSKTIAEQAAWKLVDDAGARDRLAVVNPGAIIGPVLGADRSYSLQAVERLLSGVPAAPRIGFSFVDVRDVADLHIRAMTTPEAGGERFLAVDTFMFMPDIARVLRERLGDEARKVPTRTMPDLMVRAMALFDGGIRSVVGDLGKRTEYSNEKARTMLGWAPRPVEDSIEETARSLIAHPAAKGA